VKVTIYLQTATVEKNLPTRLQFKQWVHAALLQADPELLKADALELTVRLVDKVESAFFNEKYRHKQGPTNVLSFPSEKAELEEARYLGDLVICAPLVQEEALVQDKQPIAHWAHLTVHGTLHLSGYDHEESAEAEEMESLEVKVLAALDYENPYEIW
jgi:probable rRNA maturation factor